MLFISGTPLSYNAKAEKTVRTSASAGVKRMKLTMKSPYSLNYVLFLENPELWAAPYPHATPNPQFPPHCQAVFLFL